MEIVNDKEKRKYNGSRRKTIPIIITCSMIFLLVGIAIGSTDVSYTDGVFWSRLDNTIVLTNESENVNIGENATTDYRLKVNGTSYFNDTLTVNGVINANGGNSENWNTAYSWGDHSLMGYLTGWSDGDPFFNNSASYHITQAMMDNWNASGGGDGHWKLNSTTVVLNVTTNNVSIGKNAPTSFKLNVTGNTNIMGNLNVSGDTTVNTLTYDDSGNFFNLYTGNNVFNLWTNQTKPDITIEPTGEITMLYQSGARARLSTNQFVKTGIWNKLRLNIEDYDQNNDFDSFFLYRFIAPVNGIYSITYSVGIYDLENTRYLLSGIFKNSILSGGYHISYSSDSLQDVFHSGADCLYLNHNDYLELYVFHNAGSSRWFPVNTYTNYMTVCKIA